MKNISFEEAIKKLEEVIEVLEAGELSLEESLKGYEEGVKLAADCRKKLDKARGRIEILAKKETGKKSK